MKKPTVGMKIFRLISISFLLLFSCATIYPFVNALAYSFSDAIETSRGAITIYPRGFTLANYNLIFARRDVLPAAFISVSRTVIGIIYHVFLCGIASYALSREELPFNKTITIYLIIPMYIGAGMIPVYVLYYNLGLMNNFLAYILPHAFGGFNMLVMRTYFRSIPKSLSESAVIDGASELKIFIRVIIPLSMPIIAVIALFQGVWQWNAWMDAMLYISNVRLHPLAMLLQRIIKESQISDADAIVSMVASVRISPLGVKMAMLIVATVPIVTIYPFFQRYFVKGIMIGAVKG